jgi:hypothetical protein
VILNPGSTCFGFRCGTEILFSVGKVMVRLFRRGIDLVENSSIGKMLGLGLTPGPE